MRIRNLDLVIVACFAVSGIGWALLPGHPSVVGMLLAIPLVFVLPGYTLTQALFRSRLERDSPDSSGRLILLPSLKIEHPFGMLDHVVFSLGLSLVIDVIVGFLLNLLPVGLQWQSWTLSLGLLTVVFALFAALLRSGRSFKRKSTAKWRITFREGAMFGAALIIVALAYWLSLIRPPQPQPSFTQLWMLSSAQANHMCAVRVGVQNFESGPVTYRLQVTSNGTQVMQWPSIRLSIQQEWERVVPISSAAGGSTLVDARLYRLDQQGEVYREAHVTLHGCMK